MLNWCAASRSSYYYKPKTGRQGRKPSTHTPLRDGDRISNQSVVIAVKFMLSIEFMDYGYRKMSVGLQQEGFLINKKKVYRLMKENGLLYNSKIAARAEKRNFVKYLRNKLKHPCNNCAWTLNTCISMGMGVMLYC